MADDTELEDDTVAETPDTTTETAETTAPDQTLFDAVNAALEGPKLEGEETDEETEETEETEEGAETEAELEDLDKTDAAKAAAAAAGKDKTADGKKPDPVNDPIPDTLQARTKERMENLIGLVKQKDAMLESQHGILNAITNTGASPQEFGAMIGYMSWVHSEEPTKLKMARDLLMSELEGVCLKLGEAAPGIDFIAKHPDIQAMVQAGQITQEAANELAITRSRKAAADHKTQVDAERTATETAQTKERDTAIAGLNALGAQMAKTDADYKRKFKLMQDNGLMEALRELPVKQWKDAFLRAYNRIPAAASAVAGTGKPPAKPLLLQGRNGNGQYNGAPPARPLRVKAPAGAGNGTRGPSSALDAMNSALENMR